MEVRLTLGDTLFRSTAETVRTGLTIGDDFIDEGFGHGQNTSLVGYPTG